ncbi:MAG: hypothetical protein HWE30_13860 [Methylocystaceae bacterium]|nr:hypothetical protein [Methylocystaceae bacterium]
MKILVVEDEKYKRDQVLEALETMDFDFEIVISISFNDAISKVDTDQFDLLVLDMSLPTYSHQNEDGGGSAQSFGGIDVLRHAEFADNLAPAIFITQYKHFDQGENELTLEDLRRDLHEEFERAFVDVVYYRYINETWKETFVNLIKEQLSKMGRLI